LKLLAVRALETMMGYEPGGGSDTDVDFGDGDDGATQPWKMLLGPPFHPSEPQQFIVQVVSLVVLL
jgi:hypothetical protein